MPLEKLPDALATGDWLVVAGLFDPLTATQARRLADLANNGRKLLAIIETGNPTLLSAEARAALAAGLREVQAVAIAGPDDWHNLIPETSRVQVIEDAESERLRTEEFIQFVLKRQHA